MSIQEFILIIASVVASSGIVCAQGKASGSACCTGIPTAPGKIQTDAGVTDSAKATTKKLPRLVDLGAAKCIPCKMMAPILESLKTEYAGRMDVEFIDVWKTPEAGKAYGVRIIPTQIFFGADGKELFRHEGFFGREEILAKWKELGEVLAPKTQ